MRHVRAKQDEVPFLLQNDFLARKQQDETPAHQNIERLDGNARRPITASLSLRMGEPLQFQIAGPKWVVFTRHEVTHEPAPGVPRGASDISRNRGGHVSRTQARVHSQGTSTTTTCELNLPPTIDPPPIRRRTLSLWRRTSV